MANTSEGMESHTVYIFWTDVPNSSEFVTEEISVDTAESASFNLTGLIYSAVLCGFIVLANIISLVAFLMEKRLRTYNNYFIINLVILDLLVGIGLCIAVEHTYIGYYPYSQNMCKVFTGIFNGIVNASNVNVVVICADRHQAVYDPINHFISRTKRKAVIINSLPWVIGLSFWLGYVTVWEFVVNFDNGMHCSQLYFFNPLTSIGQSVAMFYLPLIIIAILYIRIFIKIQKRLRGRNLDKTFDLKDALKSSSVSRSNAMSREGLASSSSTLSAGHIVVTKSDEKTTESSSSDENTIWTRDQGLSKSPSPRGESTTEMTRATRTLLLIVIVFVTTWIPISIITVIFSIRPHLIIPGLPNPAFVFFANLQYGNNLLNPVSYALSQPLFRATVIRMFTCKQQ